MRPKAATLAMAAALAALVGCVRRDAPTPPAAGTEPRRQSPVTFTDGAYVAPAPRPAFTGSAVPPPSDIAAVLEAVNDPDIRGRARRPDSRKPDEDGPVRVRTAARARVSSFPLAAPSRAPGAARAHPAAPYALAPSRPEAPLPTGKSRLLSD
jgi:hypothetical protein